MNVLGELAVEIGICRGEIVTAELGQDSVIVTELSGIGSCKDSVPLQQQRSDAKHKCTRTCCLLRPAAAWWAW